MIMKCMISGLVSKSSFYHAKVESIWVTNNLVSFANAVRYMAYIVEIFIAEVVWSFCQCAPFFADFGIYVTSLGASLSFVPSLFQ